MKSRREYTDYLRDMLEASTKAIQFAKDVDFEAFSKNEEKVFAVIPAFEIIGEAAKNAPRSIRGRYSKIPWEDIVGMRNKVIHGYFGVDLEVIWKTVHENLPPLEVGITKILEDLIKKCNFIPPLSYLPISPSSFLYFLNPDSAIRIKEGQLFMYDRVFLLSSPILIYHY